MSGLSPGDVGTIMRIDRCGASCPRAGAAARAGTAVSVAASPAAPPALASPLRSEHLAVLNKPRPVGERVIERPRGRIGFVRVPVNPAGARGLRLPVDRLDQSATEPELAGALGHEQILQIAI